MRYHPATLRSHQITSRLIVVLVNCWHLMQVRLSRWKSSCSRVEFPQQFGARSVAVWSNLSCWRSRFRLSWCDQVKTCFIFFMITSQKNKWTVKKSVNPLWSTQSAAVKPILTSPEIVFAPWTAGSIKFSDTFCTLDTVVCENCCMKMDVEIFDLPLFFHKSLVTSWNI